MKLNLKLILGILVIVIIVAALSIWLLPGSEEEITGAAVSGGVATEVSDCPVGNDLKILNQCKAWKNSGVKVKELEILTDDSLDKFCDKIIEMYPSC